MMKSKRAQRMAKKHNKLKNGASVNLVSLMDVFTILVFFLLVSQSEVDELPKDDQLKLPESIAQKKPEQTVTIMIARDRILVQGNQVAAIDDVVDQEEKIIGTVRQALEKELKKVVVKDVGANEQLQEITILGDRTIPFNVLKKVMNTCTELGYTRISLAVVQKSAAQS